MREDLAKILLALKVFGKVDRSMLGDMAYDSYKLRLKVLKWMGCIDVEDGVVKPAGGFEKCLELLGIEKANKPIQKDVKQELAILLIGDVHVGRKTDTYNYDIARRRMEAILSRAKSLYEDGYRIVVLGLGDYVDGAEIYGRQAYEQEFDPNIQVVRFVELMSPLMEVADKFYGIAGNHGRVNDEESANYDYLAMETLRTAFKNKVVSSQRYVDVFVIDGWKVLLSHAKFRMTYGIPDYSIRRFVYNQLLNHRDLKAVFIGHYHSFKTWREGDVLVVLNGTFLSGDELSYQYGLRPSVSQAFIINGGNRLIVEEVWLEHKQ